MKNSEKDSESTYINIGGKKMEYTYDKHKPFRTYLDDYAKKMGWYGASAQRERNSGSTVPHQ